MSYITSPNMSLQIPGVGLEPGPQYATDVNNSLTIIDSHNHTPGSGVLVPVSGLSILIDFPLNDNNLTLARTIRFQPQTSTPSGAQDLGCLYEGGVDLYYIDGNGNQIRMTESGSIVGAAGTITGLPSGTASASYSAGTFVFQSATATAANIDGGSYILRDSTASSYGLTLAPPTLSSNYSITLPLLPVSTEVVIMDPTGIMGTVTYDGVGQNMSSVGANAVANSRTRAIGSAVGDIDVTPSSGVFSITSTSPTVITNQLASLVTSGRPVMVMFTGDALSPSYLSVSAGNTLTISISNTTTNTLVYETILQAQGSIAQVPLSISAIDLSVAGSAGGYGYEVSASVTSGGTGLVVNARTFLYEL